MAALVCVERTPSGDPAQEGGDVARTAGVPRAPERWLALAGEGGHVSFAPGSELEIELLQALTTRHGR
uniref:glucokinase n=1 Tax=Escherichia coli TaxID=562 RepID=UPI003EB736FD